MTQASRARTTPHTRPGAPSRSSAAPRAGFLERRGGLVLAALAAVYAIAATAVCAVKYRFYLYRDFDLAIFAQAADRLLHGSLDNSIRGMPWLGDHASLVMFAIAPLYAIARHPMTLLALQSVALALGAVAIHRLARAELEDERLALAFAAAWLLFPAVGYANLFEFHPETLATPLLLVAFHGVRRRRALPTLAFGALALTCREDVALPVLLLGGYAILVHRRAGLLLGGALAALAIASLLLSFAVLFPAFNHGQAEHAQRYAAWGSTTGDALAAMLRDPLRVLASLVASPGDAFDAAVKREYWIHLLLPLGFLPLLAPEVFAIALPIVLEHFLSTRVQEHTVVYQYTALVTPFAFAAAIVGTRRLLAWRARRGAPPDAAAARGPAARATAIALVTLGLGANVLFGPWVGRGLLQSLRIPAPNAPTPADRTLAPIRDRMVAAIPAAGGVVANFEFLPRLAHRADVHSAHHVVGGLYTMSSLRYPPPTGVEAVLVDLSTPELLHGWNAGTPARFASLVGTHRLRPAEIADGLVLFTREPAAPIVLWQALPASAGTPRIVFDGQLALCGGGAGAESVPAGGTLPIRITWERVRPLDRAFVIRLGWFDAGGRRVGGHARDLGYGISDPAAWPAATPVEEQAHVVVPGDLAPGDYRLALAVSWRRGREQGAAIADDPALAAAGGLLPLAQVRVTERRAQ